MSYHTTWMRISCFPATAKGLEQLGGGFWLYLSLDFAGRFVGLCEAVTLTWRPVIRTAVRQIGNLWHTTRGETVRNRLPITKGMIV